MVKNRNSGSAGRRSKSLDTMPEDERDADYKESFSSEDLDSRDSGEDVEYLPWERPSECSDNEAEEARAKLVVVNEQKRLKDAH